ncbi:MAG: hypothetical protein JJU06_00375 [Ectothiorhodospiraceae bacterium]|nr:hypothetical protein [Ectothiorhodospiraceae bacterium]MCH8503983.1 hypothetical protein [Ectothiorhodospiraceae bacterium]
MLALIFPSAIAANAVSQGDASRDSVKYPDVLPAESMAAVDSLLEQFSAASACDALDENMLIYFARRIDTLVAEAVQETRRENPEANTAEMAARIMSSFDSRADRHYEEVLDRGCDDEQVQILIRQFRSNALTDEGRIK